AGARRLLARQHGAARRAATRWRRPGNGQTQSDDAQGPGKISRHAVEEEQIMKSAYELAMERLNKATPTVKLTDAQKKELADLDAKYAAKIAEREIFLKGELAAAAGKGDAEAYGQLEKQLAGERKTLKAQLEEKKEKLRKG